MGDEYGVKDGSHIPGFVLHKYLNDFATHFDIFRRIHFRTEVVSVAKSESGWEIPTVVSDSAGALEEVTYHCKKLIICSGLASNPNPLKVEANAIADDPNVERVIIVGASKTGYDAVQLMASRGKKVDWIIRESGGGAVWMSAPWIPMGPWKVMLEHIATMRFFTWFSPCVWGDFDGFRRIRKFLHGTSFGRWLAHGLWEKFRWDTVRANGYRAQKPLEHLEPDESLFWSARVGILNYPGNIHDFLTSGQVKTIKKDISHLSEGGKVHLADGIVLESDALIAITGWKLAPAIQYQPAGLEASLGVPTSDLTAEEEAFWDYLDQKADDEILSRFPYLKHGPRKPIPYKQNVSPFRLYRGIAPPGLSARGDRSIAFMKMVHSTSNIIIAETQALWVYAYLNNKLAIDKKDVYWQTALTSRYGKLRYPCGFSSWYPEFVYDAIPYADMLLSDLGVKHLRKKTWAKEVFEGYTIHDYKGINQEWKKKQLAK
ncbi:hypothetical protein DV736_g2801, partial [Chaetothyriales sp. CBS 134916]